MTEIVYATVPPLAGTGAAASAADIERTAIRRTVWRLIPVLVLCYFVAYLDRVNLSFAALQMNHALGLNGAAYGLGAGLFFLTNPWAGLHIKGPQKEDGEKERPFTDAEVRALLMAARLQSFSTS